ncbi:H-NS histone family protein [Burkholderia sp. RS02]|uniref:H-NS histone family protein n=1 Tax=unclassified Burkholderia TaxID=2613784 RepID=UPI00321890FC
MSTYQTLLAQRAVLEAEIENAKAAARQTVLAEVKRMVVEFDLSAREIFGGNKARKHQSTRARYRDPESGATWSGRGRPPAWIDGKDRAPFEIAPQPSNS